MRTILDNKKGWAKHLLDEVATAVQVETESSWQNGSSYTEEVELPREGSELRLEGSLMRQACKAAKASDRAEFLEMTSAAHGQA